MTMAESKEDNSLETWKDLKLADVKEAVTGCLFVGAKKRPFGHQPNKTVLWSNMETLAHIYAKLKGDHTLEDTASGKCLELLTMLLKEAEGSDELPYCQKALRPRWDKISAKFAREAKGDITILLNGSAEKPFDPKSTLARMEIPKLKSKRVKSVRVLMIFEDNFKDPLQIQKLEHVKESQDNLRKALDPNIGISYLYMPESLLMMSFAANVIMKEDVIEYIVTLNDRLFNDRLSYFATFLESTGRLYKQFTSLYDLMIKKI